MPCLLLQGNGLVKTVGFKKPRYLGDPINAVRIFNDKEIDELLLLDISPCRTGSPINFELVEEIVSEAFVPVAYGGGIATIEDGRRLMSLGVEKLSINTAAVDRPDLIDELSAVYGASTVVVAIDVKKRRKKYEVMTRGGEHGTGLDPVAWAREAQARGAGEILVNSIDADGEMSGYDLELVRLVAEALVVPVIACGGAATTADFRAATKEAHASACAAGSMFVYQGRHRAVLISFPTQDDLDRVLEVGS